MIYDSKCKAKTSFFAGFLVKYLKVFGLVLQFCRFVFFSYIEWHLFVGAIDLFSRSAKTN
jgi:hypothetical protein